MYCLLQIARDEDLTNQIGKHLFFDLVDHDVVKSYRIQQEVPFKMFKVSSFFSTIFLACSIDISRLSFQKEPGRTAI